MSAPGFPSKFVVNLETGAVAEEPLVVDPRLAATDAHDCDENAVPYVGGGGALGHGWECGVCGAFLQAG